MPGPEDLQPTDADIERDPDADGIDLDAIAHEDDDADHDQPLGLPTAFRSGD